MEDTPKRRPGRPKGDTKTVPLVFRLNETDRELIPKNANGNPDQEWIRGAVLARLASEGIK